MKTITHYCTMTKNPPVYFHYLSFSSSSGTEPSYNYSHFYSNPLQRQIIMLRLILLYNLCPWNTYVFDFAYDGHIFSCCAYWPNADIWECLNTEPFGTCCYKTFTSISQCDYWFHWNTVLVKTVHLYSLAFYHACFLLSLALRPFSILCLASFHTQTLCMLIAYFRSKCKHSYFNLDDSLNVIPFG